MINPRPEYQEIGEQIAKLLASEHCPQSLRSLLEDYLSGLYKQANLLKPEIVNSLFPYLMIASESSANDALEISAGEIVAEAQASKEAGETAGVASVSKPGVTGRLMTFGII